MRSGEKIRQSIALSAVLMAALFLLPLAVIAPFRPALFFSDAPADETADEPFVSGELDAQRPLRVLDGENVLEMDMGAYLVGVVRAEMPASFELEALKAQAAAARTYTLYKLQSGSSHGDAADICTDSTCCQAYISEERARANWGQDAERYEKKVEEAVRATDGQAILYGGVPILAVFHSSSSGLTRTAGTVWMNDLPYLQAVSSPETGEAVPNYYSRVEIALETFKEKCRAAHPEADFSGHADGWLKNAVVDGAGSVETVEVGGVLVKGSELRSILGLRSACFEWELREDMLVFFVTGYGHGVGLSQYGANHMAEQGADYREILTHYYTGVTVEPYLYNDPEAVVK